MKELDLKTNLPLSKFTTWRIGGPAEWISEPKDINEVKRLVSWAKNQQINCNIIGAGSNLLISDKGLEGLTLCMRQLRGFALDPKDGIIEVLSGEYLPSLARRAAKKGLHGLEWAVGIPGTVGGAVAMNAGASGGCIADRLESIKVINISNGKEYELQTKDLNFAYRHSRLQNEKIIVLSARFKLEPGYPKKDLREITNAMRAHRINTQPYHEHTCGSVFRNPEPMKAGKLIETLGLKGFQIGGAKISTMHANFIINNNNASSQDIEHLISFIQTKVHKAYGVLLHPEVKTYGF